MFTLTSNLLGDPFFFLLGNTTSSFSLHPRKQSHFCCYFLRTLGSLQSCLNHQCYRTECCWEFLHFGQYHYHCFLVHKRPYCNKWQPLPHASFALQNCFFRLEIGMSNCHKTPQIHSLATWRKFSKFAMCHFKIVKAERRSYIITDKAGHDFFDQYRNYGLVCTGTLVEFISSRFLLSREA